MTTETTDALVARLREDHPRRTAGESAWCDTCGTRWPCDTAQLLDALDALRADLARTRDQLHSRMAMHDAAKNLLDLLHTLGQQHAPGEPRPLVQIVCADDVTAEALTTRLNALWALVQNGEPAPMPGGFVQVPSHMMPALRRRAEQAEADLARVTAERDALTAQRAAAVAGVEAALIALDGGEATLVAVWGTPQVADAYAEAWGAASVARDTLRAALAAATPEKETP